MTALTMAETIPWLSELFISEEENLPLHCTLSYLCDIIIN